MKSKTSACALFAVALFSIPAFAAVSVSFDSGLFTLYNSDQSTVLEDGFIVQFGYYDEATTDSLFAGEWVALTGIGSTNPGIETNINGASFGSEYAGQFYFDSLSISTSVPNGTIMAIRFYNGPTLESSTHYGVVSSATDTNLVWPGVADSVYYQIDGTAVWLNGHVAFTGTPLGDVIPEPAAFAAVSALAALGFAATRRRRV